MALTHFWPEDSYYHGILAATDFVQPGRIQRFAGSGMVINDVFFVGGSRRQTRSQPLAKAKVCSYYKSML